MTHANGASIAAIAEVRAPELLEQHRRGGSSCHRPSDRRRPALLAESAPVALQPL
jgi:hypothetical protein